MSNLIERVISDSQGLFGRALRFWDETLSPRTESPIERAFLLSLIAGMSAHGIPWIIRDDRDVGKEDVLKNQNMTAIIPQCPIEEYRVDFLLITTSGAGVVEIVVECDGHDFHERTKAQAERDRTRDRRMQALGFQVFRFTGPEIFRDPVLKAREIYEHIGRVDGVNI